MKKCWIISEFYYPVVVTTGYYVTEIAESLAKEGIPTGVITTSNTYYKADIISQTKYEVRNGVEIWRAVEPQVDKDQNLKRVWRLWASSVKLFGLSVRKIKKGDIVVVLTNPAFFMLFMPIARLIIGCKYHILVHDIFPENLVSLGKIRSTSLSYKLLKHIFDRAYRKADSCIAIGRDMLEVIKRKTNNEKQLSLITNWADVNEVVPREKVNTELFQALKGRVGNSVIFQFAGNLGKAQGLDNLMAGIDLVKNNSAAFLFVGTGAKLQDVEMFTDSHINTISCGFIGRDRQNDFLNACDIGIVTLADGMYGLGVPSKSYNIMATGKPILYVGELDSEIALCIQEFNIGWVVEPNNPQAFADCVDAIMEDLSLIDEMGKRALDVAQRVFSKKTVLDKYCQFVNNQMKS